MSNLPPEAFSHEDREEPSGIHARMPPASLDAEAAVVSACMLEPGAIDQAIGLKPEDFYSESNRRIFEAELWLSENGKPVDIVMVKQRLADTGRLEQVGGAAYLAQIADATPAVARVEEYAAIVRDKAVKRRVIAACQKAAAEGYSDQGTGAEFADRTEQAIYEINRVPTGTGVQQIEPIIRAVFQNMTELAKRGERITGVPTGFERLDSKTAGLHDGELTIVAARPGMGKAQPLGAKVLTPTGWARMGNLKVGDSVIGANGEPTRVTAIFDRGRLPVFRVTMSDGASTECCDDHLWVTRTRGDRRRGTRGAIRSLREIRETLHRHDGGLNHSIQYVAPVRYEAAGDLPLDPYLLGVYVGDGHCSHSVVISNPELDIQRAVAELVPASDLAATGTDGLTIRVRKVSPGRERSAFTAAIERLGLRGACSEDKFVPPAYLRADTQARTRLLHGLCDTDGFVTVGGKSIEYTTTSERLRDDIVELVAGLGGYVTWTEKLGTYRLNGEQRTTRIAYRMILAFPRGDIVPVSSAKHLAKWNRAPHRLGERFVQSVEASGDKICRCIAVESDDHLYVTDGYIVTHNTSLVLNIAVSVASPRVVPAEDDRYGEAREETEEPGLGVAIFSLEMPREQLASRMVCAEGRVEVGKMRQGLLQDRDWDNLTKASGFLYRLPIWIDDAPAIGVLEIRAKVRRLQAESARSGNSKIGLVVVDYLQLMSGSGYTHSREQEVSEISRGLKRIAKELRLPVIALSQLNRAVETRASKDKRPQLSDLRESGAIEQDADNIIFIYRDDYYEQDSDQKGIAELIVAKQRNGPTGKVKVRFDAAYTRFDNLAPGEMQEFDE